ncbi:hypothetical protein TNCV_738031 [Trichonephila clavipes]|nr:hypothetical protein TNCV_738031 [Trichonephila clavipes]
MDDNTWTADVQQLLESEDITRMAWPVFSSDLNPSEYVWDACGTITSSGGNRCWLRNGHSYLKNCWRLSMEGLCEATIAVSILRNI